MKIELFYDKECPFCKFYANYIKLKEKHKLILINVRDSQSIIELEKFRLQGLDINNEFIIRVENNELFQGVDAISFLNNLVKKKIYFPDNYLFRSIIYPIIKSIRKFILIIMGKKYNIWFAYKIFNY